MNRNVLWFLVLLIFGCSEENKIVDQMTDIPGTRWNYDQIPDYPFQVDDGSVYYDFFLKLRIAKSYPYENLYLLAHIKTPDGKIKTQKINFTLTDATGKPLGTSSGSSVDYELPMFKKNLINIGAYNISIEQNMRDSVVSGIESIGVKIKKGEPVF
jgi:gliding motility-associated lipoprotein GldH